MTTPDIAGLCERLRKPRRAGRLSQMLINPDGPEAADTLERQAAEIERLRAELDMTTPNGWVLVPRNPHADEPSYRKDQAAEIERLRGLLLLARPFVADDTEETCDLADRIDAALTGEDHERG